MANMFRQALELLNTRKGSEMSEEELQLINTAIIPLLILRAFNDVLISRGLEELAKMLEEAE